MSPSMPRDLAGTLGDSGSGSTQYGGTGQGGSAYVTSASPGPGSITIDGATNLQVQGNGGNGQSGGSGYGGTERDLGI